MRDQRAYLKEYYKRNRAKSLATSFLYAKAHPEVNKAAAKKYREANPERRVLSNIFQRCHNPSNHAFPLYGGRGIKCFFTGVEQIIGEIGKRPGKGYSLDRINNDGHYEPGNIRWATWKQQANNRRNSKP
jgi:hypothetical protein